METNDPTLFSLVIDPVIKENLKQTARWARFLAIAGMIVLGIILLATVIGVEYIGGMTAAADTADYPTPSLNASTKAGAIVGSLIVLAIAFIPLLFLFRFANSMHTAIASNNQQQLNLSFQSLKVYFRYLGIAVLMVLLFYVLAFIFVMISPSMI